MNFDLSIHSVPVVLSLTHNACDVFITKSSLIRYAMEMIAAIVNNASISPPFYALCVDSMTLRAFMKKKGATFRLLLL